MGTFSILRVLFIGLGGILGLYGIALGFLCLIAYLTSLDSYGAPYLAPYAPLILEDLQDGMFKESNLKMKNRPKSVPNINSVRQGGKDES